MLWDGRKLINGNSYSWSSIKLLFGSEEVDFLGSITFGEKRTRSKGYGLGRAHRPTRRSAGKYETDAMKLKGFVGGMSMARAFLCQYAIDGRSYGDVIFDVSVQLIESNETPIDVFIEGAVWSTNNDDYQEGPDLLQTDVEFDIMGIRRYSNGKLMTLFNSSEEVIS